MLFGLRALCSAFILSTALASSSFARDVWIDNRQSQTWESAKRLEYQSIVSELASGDQVQFSDGRRFEVGSVLGSGDRSLVLLATSGSAYRIPFAVYATPGEEVAGYVDANAFLVAMGVPTVEILSSRAAEYVEVRREDIQFNFADFYGWIHGGVSPRASRASREQVENDLVEFAGKAAAVDHIRDLSDQNLVYTGDRGWRVLDALPGARAARRGERKVQLATMIGVFSEDPLVKELIRRIRQASYARRQFPCASALRAPRRGGPRLE